MWGTHRGLQTSLDSQGRCHQGQQRLGRRPLMLWSLHALTQRFEIRSPGTTQPTRTPKHVVDLVYEMHAALMMKMSAPYIGKCVQNSRETRRLSKF